MPVISKSFDLQSVEWRRVTGPDCKDFRVDFEYSLLGYDLPSGRLDMLLRYAKGGHCRRHRHVASTVTLVLEGEQFLKEMSPDGILFEYFDENMQNRWTLSIEEYVESWNNRTVYGAAPSASKPATA